MKKMFNYGVFILIFFSFLSCQSSINNSPKTQESTDLNKVKESILNDTQISGNVYEGLGHETDVTLTFNEDKTFVYASGDKTFKGTWDYNKDFPMYPISISWVNENGELDGYIIRFDEGDNEYAYTVHGAWIRGFGVISLQVNQKVE